MTIMMFGDLILKKIYSKCFIGQKVGANYQWFLIQKTTVGSTMQRVKFRQSKLRESPAEAGLWLTERIFLFCVVLADFLIFDLEEF